MKKLALLILMVMFLANTIVVSAWAAGPCPTSDSTQTSQAMDTSMPDNLPCHNEQNKKPCKDICPCIHGSVSQALLNSGPVIPIIVTTSENLAADNESMDSRATYPPYRPPILIS